MEHHSDITFTLYPALMEHILLMGNCVGKHQGPFKGI